MRSQTLAKVLAKGIVPGDPRFPRAVAQLENQQRRDERDRHKQNALRGAERTLHLSQPAEILAWLRGDGRAVRLGQIDELEIWQRGQNTWLAVKNPHWEVFSAVRTEQLFRILHRVV